MWNRTIRPVVTVAVVAVLALGALTLPQPARAAWHDQSGDLPNGRDSGASTLALAGGAIAVGVGVWALVRHHRHKTLARLEQTIDDRRAAIESELRADPAPAAVAAAEPAAAAPAGAATAAGDGPVGRALERISGERVEALLAR